MTAVYAAYAAVSASTFTIYALVVSAAGAPPSVHAAGLMLWVAHVILIFGRTPERLPGAGRRRELGELGREGDLDRAADVAAGLGRHARTRPRRDEHRNAGGRA